MTENELEKEVPEFNIADEESIRILVEILEFREDDRIGLENIELEEDDPETLETEEEPVELDDETHDEYDETIESDEPAELDETLPVSEQTTEGL